MATWNMKNPYYLNIVLDTSHDQTIDLTEFELTDPSITYLIEFLENSVELEEVFTPRLDGTLFKAASVAVTPA